MATEFAKWVSDLDARATGNGNPESENQDDEEDGWEMQFGGENPTARRRTPEENLKDLEQEMKLLHWHKLANEAALKAALIKTKRLKKKEALQRGNMRENEKAAWMQQVIQEEQAKPLEVSEEYIRAFHERQHKEDERVERHMKNHLSNIQRIKEDMEKKEEVKKRKESYHQKISMLNKRAQEVQEASLTRSKYGAIPKPIPDHLLDTSTLLADANTAGFSPSNKTQSPSQNLGKVVTSLDKLVELEKRISQLEREYDDTSSGPNGLVQFAKQKVAGNGKTPAQTKYHVRLKPKRGLNKIRNSFQSKTNGGSDEEEEIEGDEMDVEQEGTFLTSISKSSTAVKRKKKSEVSTMVQQRGRATEHKSTSKQTSRVRSKLRGAQRQDAVVSKWLKERSGQALGADRKKKSLALVSKNPGTRKIPTAKERLKEFKEVRKQYTRKKETMMRSLHSRYDGGPIKRTPASTRVGRTNTSELSKQRAHGVVVRNAGVNRGGVRSVRIPDTSKRTVAPGNSLALTSTTRTQRSGGNRSKVTSTTNKTKLIGRNGNAVRTGAKHSGANRRAIGSENGNGGSMGLGIIGTGTSAGTGRNNNVILPRIK